MFETKDVDIIKKKACAEVAKIARRFENANDTQKTDWDNLEAVLRAYKHLLMIDSMEQNSYSNGYYMRDDYSNNYSGRRDSMGRYASSYDDYSGHYDNRVIEDMMRNASPQERQVLERMMGRR